MKIRWNGHSCFTVEGENTTVILDPHDGKSIGIRPPRLRGDIVLVTHDHFDHNAVKTVQGEPKVIDSEFNGKIGDVEIKTIMGYHDRVQGAKRGEMRLYKFTVDGIRMLHCGDLGHIPTPGMLEKMGKVDVLFVPVGGVFTIEPEEAKETVKLINPGVVVPMHYRIGGLSLSIRPLNDFTALFPEENIIRVGNEVEFYSSDMEDGEIPESIWVFSL